MNEAELIKRIHSGEDLHTEFKRELPDNEALAKSLVSFSNTDGGQLIIGIDDSGDSASLESIDQIIRKIDDVAYNRCEPPISIVQETLLRDEKSILIVNVPKGSQRPYRTQSGTFYIRSTNRTRQASREELLRLFQSSESIYFDETPLSRASYADLDRDYFSEFLERFLALKAHASDIDNYLMNLNLIDRAHKPTLAGMLFFGKNPQQFLPMARVVGAAIRGYDIAVPPFDKKDIDGKVRDIIENAHRFIKIHILEEHRIEGFENEIRLEIPELALRESYINAIAHRDYTISAPVRIIIYADRLEVRTPGKLPNNVTIESIRIGGAHVLRNPTIYNLLAKMGMVTDLGSGVRRIITSVREHLGKEVDLEATETELVLKIPRK